MEDLQKDINSLRSSLPHNLLSISNPIPLHYYLSEDDTFVISSLPPLSYIDTFSHNRFLNQSLLPSSSPNKYLQAIAVDLLLHGPSNSPYGLPSHPPHEVRVTFVDLSLAQVGFRSLIDHPNLHNGLVSTADFFSLVMSLVKEYSILTSILLSLQRLLQGPMHPCESCNSFFDSFSSHEVERLRIATTYRNMAKHPELFPPPGEEVEWDDSWFDPLFIRAVRKEREREKEKGEKGREEGKKGKEEEKENCRNRKEGEKEEEEEEGFRSILQEENEGIFSLPIFSSKFCTMIMDEVDNYATSGLPKKRPNSMNNYGLILNEIGMANFFTQFQRLFLQPLTSLLFPLQGASLDNHHTFVVQYKPGEDLGLDMHVDDAEVTVNVCLGREFAGAGLTFCGSLGGGRERKKTLGYQHVVGRGVVHLGTRRHGADEIAWGERMNLIIWNRCHAFRSSTLVERGRGGGEVDLVCLSRAHDEDYEEHMGGKLG